MGGSPLIELSNEIFESELTVVTINSSLFFVDTMQVRENHGHITSSLLRCLEKEKYLDSTCHYSNLMKEFGDNRFLFERDLVFS